MTPNFFETLGVKAVFGRTPGDDATGAVYNVAERWTSGTRQMVISERLWQRRFASDASILNRAIDVDGRPWVIVGVVPTGLEQLADRTDVWIPWNIPDSYRSFAAGPPKDWRFLHVIGRLKPGIEAEAASLELRRISSDMAADFPKEDAGYTTQISGVDETLRGAWRRALLAFSALLGVVLLVACSSVANLQAAVAIASERDTAVKLALGAAPARLRRESVCLGIIFAAVSAALAIPLAQIILRMLASAAPLTFARLLTPSATINVIAGTMALALVCGLLVVIVPLLRARQPMEPSRLRGRQVGKGMAVRTRRFLLAAQVAVTVALVGASVVLVGSVNRLVGSDSGFDVENVVVMPIALDNNAYRTGDQSRAFYHQLIEELSGLPGVSVAGAVTALPLSDDGIDFERPYSADDWKPAVDQRPAASIRMATPGYFAAVGARMVAGRTFDSSDRAESRRIAVINETLAHRAWGTTTNPVGRQLYLDYQGGQYPYKIVGVVGDMKFGGPRSRARAEVFIPHSQNPYLAMVAVVRMNTASDDREQTVRAAVTRLDPTQPTGEVVTFSRLLNRSLAVEQFAATLIGLLALAAAILSAAGANSLATFGVIMRGPEFALRRSLGATDRSIVRMVLAEMLSVVGAGAIVGIAATVGVVRAISPLVFGVSATDAVGVVAAGLILTLAMMVAASVPARRAIVPSPAAELRA